jgi:hypothetical protein
MAVYSYTTSVAQERALTRDVVRYNADSGNPGAPNVTNVQFLRKSVDILLDARVALQRELRKELLEQKYEEATPANRTTVDNALGFTD